MAVWRFRRYRLFARFQLSVESLVPKSRHYLPRQRSGLEYGRASPEEADLRKLALGNGVNAAGGQRFGGLRIFRYCTESRRLQVAPASGPNGRLIPCSSRERNQLTGRNLQ